MLEGFGLLDKLKQTIKPAQPCINKASRQHAPFRRPAGLAPLSTTSGMVLPANCKHFESSSVLSIALVLYKGFLIWHSINQSVGALHGIREWREFVASRVVHFVKSKFQSENPTQQPRSTIASSSPATPTRWTLAAPFAKHSRWVNWTSKQNAMRNTANCSLERSWQEYTKQRFWTPHIYSHRQ